MADTIHFPIMFRPRESSSSTCFFVQGSGVEAGLEKIWDLPELAIA